MTTPINLTQLREQAIEGTCVIAGESVTHLPITAVLALIDTAEAAIAYVSDVATWKEHDRLRETLNHYTTNS
jgi:hypothetical protein